MHRIARSLRRLSLPALALPTAVIAMAVTLGTGTDAADLRRWAAGDPASVSSAAPVAAAQAVAGQAAAAQRVLGLAGAASHRVEIVDDRFHGRVVDDVTYLDARGRPIGVVRVDTDGRVISAVRLEYREAYATGPLAADGALAKARGVLAALDVAIPPVTPIVRATMNGTLWTLTWPRSVDGIPVDGDGLTVRIWRNGEIHSVTVSERPLARPAGMIGAGQARGMLEPLLPTIVTGDRRADGTLDELGLHWVAANDRYRPEAADAPAPVLRLAYVFEMRFGGPSAELLRAVTFWIDAETGALIGGDVLR